MKDSAVKRTVLTIACLSAFIVPFIGSSVNIALPTIGKEFKIDAVTLGWVPTSYLLASAMFLLPFGRIADIYGRKKIFLAGTVIYTIGSLFCALSLSGLMLIACCVIQGIGSAMTFGTSMAILTSVFPTEERGRAIGITTASVYSGLSLGPFLGGFLTQHLGWRSVFYFNVPFGLMVIVLVLWQLKGEWAEARGERVDLPGSIVYALTLLLVMYGLSLLPAGSGIGLIGVGAIGVIGFFFLEARNSSPILNVQIFRHNPVFTFSNLAAFIHYSSTFAVTFLMSLYLQYIKGLNAQSAGIILISQPLMMTAFSPLAGRLSDRIEPKVIASLGMACTCAAIFLLSFIGNKTGLPYIIFTLLSLGFGFALFSSPNTNAVMSSVEKHDYGVASGTMGTMRLIGQMFSMGMAMMIFSMVIGKVSITPFLYPLFLRSLKIALVINGSLCFIGIFLSLARGKIQRQDLDKPS
ncbi:MAG: MFS transporter [Thermodesulfobacteriota bacterium]|jgi:EmrB/QacA subfamily drug resistance transporter